jgi:hypothetical protein
LAGTCKSIPPGNVLSREAFTFRRYLAHDGLKVVSHFGLFTTGPEIKHGFAYGRF